MTTIITLFTFTDNGVYMTSCVQPVLPVYTYTYIWFLLLLQLLSIVRLLSKQVSKCLFTWRQYTKHLH